jgi:hypothetical protein
MPTASVGMAPISHYFYFQMGVERLIDGVLMAIGLGDG